MRRSSRTAFSMLGIALLAAGALAGCATGTGSGSAPSEPAESPTMSTETELDAAWVDGGRMIGIVTRGSSTCIPTAGEVSYANGVIDVELIEPDEGTACTRDLVPRATLVATPEGVDPTADVEIRVTSELYHGDTELDGAPGLVVGGEGDFAPSAGWTGEDGQFVIVTWGSSSCVPVVEETVASGPAEVTVTFATPPADQVCTMDMAPRGTVGWVDGLEADDDVELVLQGDNFDGIRIPIVGSD